MAFLKDCCKPQCDNFFQELISCLFLWIFFFFSKSVRPEPILFTRKVTLMINVKTGFSNNSSKAPAEIIFLLLCIAPSPTFHLKSV